jgi:hypothetical protein
MTRITAACTHRIIRICERRAKATNHQPAPPSSADVAVNYCHHPTQKPRQGFTLLALSPEAVGRGGTPSAGS